MNEIARCRCLIGMLALLLFPTLLWAQRDTRLPPDVQQQVERQLGKDPFKSAPPPTQLEEAAKQRTLQRSSKMAEDAVHGRGEISRRRNARDRKDLSELERYNASIDDAWARTAGWAKEMERERSQEGEGSLFSTVLITLLLAAGAYFFFMNRYIGS